MNKTENLKKALDEFNEELTIVRKNIVRLDKYSFDDVIDYNEIDNIQNTITRLKLLITHISSPRISNI